MSTPPDPGQPRTKDLLERAEMLTEMGRPEAAVAAALEALSRAPESGQALCALAWAQWNAGHRDAAVASAGRACAAAPDLEWGHRLRAIFHQEAGEYGPAVAAGREAVRLAPRSSSALFALSDALMHAEALDEAMRVALRLREVAPESIWSHEMCGGVALWGKRYAEAEAHFRRGLALVPHRYVSLFNLGLALLHQGRAREAVDCFTETQTQRPDDKRAPMVAHNLRVAVLTYLGDNKKTSLPTEAVSPEERARRWASLPASVREWYAAQASTPPVTDR